MEITTEMLADLKAKAKAATPGPWEKDCLRNIFRKPQDRDGDWQPIVLAKENHGKYFPGPENTAYIVAASPDVVLAMASEIERLRAENKRLLVEAHDLDSSGGEMAKDCRSLEKEADWLAGNLEKACHLVGPVCFTTARTCPIRCNVDNESTRENATTFSWRVAARYAVEKSGNLSQP